MDTVKTYFKTEDLKSEHRIKTEQDYTWEEDVQKTIKAVSFAKQWNQVKRYHNKDIDMNVLLALKKLNTSYNISSLN